MIRRFVVALISIAAVVVVLVAIASLVPVWPLVLVEHFRVQLVLGGAVVILAAAALGVAGYFDAAVLATGLHAVWLAGDLCAAPPRMPASGAHVRVLILNVLTENHQFDDVRALIAEVQPDVIGLVEVDQRWLTELAPAVAAYPGRLEQPRRDNFGVALYSRAPLSGAIEHLDRDHELPVAVAAVALDGAALQIILVHPLPPMSGAAVAQQRDELDGVADRVRALPGPALVIGDLNATPWSTPFRQLVARSGLCDSRAGFGVDASFPSMLPALLRIPIDHALVSCDVGVAERRIERPVGSDHLPVVLELVVPRG